MNAPRVLIGCPTCDVYEYCLDEYASRVKELTYPQYDIVIADNSKTDKYVQRLQAKGLPVVKTPYLEDVRERIVCARNVLRERVLSEGYDYFLSLEQDVIPPKDVVERLLGHQKLVISGVYYKYFTVSYAQKGKIVKEGVQKIMPLIYTFVPGMKAADNAHMCSAEEVAGEKVFRIRAAGLGVMLMHRSVLERVKFRSSKDGGTFDDMLFANDLFHLNIPMFVDTSVKAKHMITRKYEKKRKEEVFPEKRGKN